MKNRTKLVSLLLALALLLAMLPATVLAESPQENPPPVTGEYEVVITDCALPDYDDYTEAELLEGYLYSISGLYDGAAAFHAPRKPLPEETQTIYDALKPLVEKVAAGTITDTVFDLGVLFTWTAEELGTAGNFMSGSNFSDATSAAVSAKLGNININELLSRLLSQMPFDLYWFDKTYTNAFSLAYSIGGSGNEASGTVSVSVTVKMIVSKDYAPPGTIGGYAVDSAKIQKINAAVTNANQVVTDNAGKTDYEKLVAYRQKICNLVSYNSTAANNTSTPYGDPWQLIYVFDGDDSTNVVCEGYSKAFKYLCDLSAFTNDITCSLVTGRMAGGTGEGNHMWNVVAIGDSNYLVDVTNCDYGTIGSPDQLFLCGVTEIKAAKKYKANVVSGVTYEYDDETISNFTEEELKLSPTAYTPSGAATPLLGDVNKDGVVTPLDMQRLYNHLNGTAILTDTTTADVNQDGAVTPLDMQRLYNHLNGTGPLF